MLTYSCLIWFNSFNVDGNLTYLLKILGIFNASHTSVIHLLTED